MGKHFLDMSHRFHRLQQYLVPTHTELDITRRDSVIKYFLKLKPGYVINFAAYTNMDESEKERNRKDKKTWKTNYVGVKNIVRACRACNTFCIQISTDAVFPGTDEYPGPYCESDAPQKNGKGLNWYGYTKLKAEEEVKTLGKKFAIIRISHPFGNPHSERALAKKTLRDIQAGHRLFADQLFTPTFLDDLTHVIWRIQSLAIGGIFHVGSQRLVSRIEFDRYLAQKHRIKTELKVGSLKEFLKTTHRAPRTRLGGFVHSETQKRLGLTFHNWDEALDKTLRRI